MAIAVGGDPTETAISDINVVPLTDVMLVLLIVFMIAVPVVLQTVPLKLPDVSYDPTVTKPENVMLSIKSDDGQSCQVYWGMTPVGHQELQDMAVAKLKAVVARLGNNITPDDLPEVHIRGDQDTPYKCIGGAIFQMQSAGFARVGFISQPNGVPTR
ncbi:MAG: ExbD/TolR family protein [Sphingomonas sp.]|jgi:biopolymer transport protein ExbD